MATTKRKKDQRRKRVNQESMAAETRAELCGVFSRRDELRRPMIPEMAYDASVAELPCVLRRMASHEAIQEEVVALAGMVWHLKDRLNRWTSAAGKTCVPSIEDFAANNKPLLIDSTELLRSAKIDGAVQDWANSHLSQ